MNDQYKYARDNRTDEQYIQNFEAGRQNQLKAMSSFVQTLHQPFRLLEIEDKPFQTDGHWEYHPDFELILNGKSFFFEVKVAQRWSSLIHIKKSQLDSLSAYENPRVLYAMPDKYTVMRLEQITRANLLESDKFGNKEVYQMKAKKIHWVDWFIRPIFENYA